MTRSMTANPMLRRGLWVAAFVPFVVLAALRIPEGPRFDEEDYAHYLLHAKAIAEGRAYTDIGFLSTPLNPWIGPVAMPPGVPTLLAPIVAIGGTKSALLPVVSLLFAIAFLTVAARYVAVSEGTSLAMAVALCAGLQPNVLHFASQPLSDLPFAALVWAVLLLGDHRSDAPWSAVRLLGITLLGAAAISTRLAGIALIPAIGAYGLLHFRTQRWRPLVPLIAWVLVFKLTSDLLPTMNAMMPRVSSETAMLWRLLRTAARTYGYAILDAQLYPFQSPSLNRLFHVATVLLLGIGLMPLARRYWKTLLGLFTFAYVSMLLIVPVSDLRYLYPLIPVALLLTLQGAVTVIEWIRPTLPARRIVAGGSVMVASLAIVASWTPATPTGITTHPEVQELYAEVRSLPRDPVPRLMVFRPRILVLETGVRAMALARGTEPEILSELCTRRITHVVLGDLGSYPAETAHLQRAMASVPGVFTRDYQNSRFTLFRVDHVALASVVGRSTCSSDAAIQRF